CRVWKDFKFRGLSRRGSFYLPKFLHRLAGFVREQRMLPLCRVWKDFKFRGLSRRGSFYLPKFLHRLAG
ncbi:hypothetical protein BD408DRAFT_319636, partial [Parasitella parasitica]